MLQLLSCFSWFSCGVPFFLLFSGTLESLSSGGAIALTFVAWYSENQDSLELFASVAVKDEDRQDVYEPFRTFSPMQSFKLKRHQILFKSYMQSYNPFQAFVASINFTSLSLFFFGCSWALRWCSRRGLFGSRCFTQDCWAPQSIKMAWNTTGAKICHMICMRIWGNKVHWYLRFIPCDYLRHFAQQSAGNKARLAMSPSDSLTRFLSSMGMAQNWGSPKKNR